jgi:hypothetical protein
MVRSAGVSEIELYEATDQLGVVVKRVLWRLPG